MSKKTYDFHVLGWGETGGELRFVKSTTRRWPNVVFENLAREMGFTQLKRDTSLVGGYFVNPSNGDCLICYPHGLDPAPFYL